MFLVCDPDALAPPAEKAGRETTITDPVEFARTRLGFLPDPLQAVVLRSRAQRGILNCTRQWGKSTVAAAKAVHRAMTDAESLVLVTAPSERQSAELVLKAADMLRHAGIAPHGDGHHAVSLVLPNGSRILGLPGNEGTVRGFTASLILIDEASRVDDAMYKALRPMLAVKHGDLWMMSTPFGRRGFFYDAWELGGETWTRVTVRATECPRIDAEFLEQERSLGMDYFRQEYMCEFVDNGQTVFGRDLVEAALDDSIEPLCV